MFGLFKKNIRSEEDKCAESLPLTKKVQFEPVPLKQVETAMDDDLRSALDYAPVNYYATKEKYLIWIFFLKKEKKKM